jgi:cytochrome c553
MSPVAAALSEDDIAGLAAFFSKQSSRPGQSNAPALLVVGRQIYDEGHPERSVPACASCHQVDGAGNARFPKVAGQHQAYALAQLVAFRNGRRATDRQMASAVKALDLPELEALAEYMASLKGVTR